MTIKSKTDEAAAIPQEKPTSAVKKTGVNNSARKNNANASSTAGGGTRRSNASSKGNTKSSDNGNGDSKSTGVANIRLSAAQYKDVVTLASYNKLLRRSPDSASGVVTAAVQQYLAALGFTLDYGMIRNEPAADYVKRLSAMHYQDKITEVIPKSYSLPKEMIEELTTIAAFNKYHELVPDGSVEIVRDAVSYYLDNLDEEFRPLN